MFVLGPLPSLVGYMVVSVTSESRSVRSPATFRGTA